MTDTDTIKTAAKEAVKEMLELLGMDVTTAAARQEVQKDLAHLRTLRLTGLAIRDKIVATASGSAATVLFVAVGYWFSHH